MMKKRRSGHNDYYDFLESPVGTVYLFFRSQSLVGISFKKPRELLYKKTETSSRLKRELGEYFEQKRTKFTCSTAFVGGTDFEKRVWNALKDVPYGETETYKWIAARIGQPRACRAVGQALGKNPIPIIFPCHRIIESDGSLGGYSSGTDIKRRLLEIEYYTRLEKT